MLRTASATIICAVPRLLLIGLAMAAVLWATPRLASNALSLAHDDQVHYGGHLVAGRILSMCPCTAQLAEAQYVRGTYHARTPTQLALLTSQRPRSMRARLAEAPVLASSALRHLGARLTA
ncbi:MAG: hypothetical protein JOZ65_34345 [Chloroflexi bacterium]|nr:hypothetical protein [Chloroflexota bacterium]